MERSQRIELLKQIQKKAPFAQGYPLLYRGERKSFDVWEIPMECLIYNQYNGRIGSVVKSYEKQNHKLNPELTDDAALIEKFLWQSKADKNEKTMGSLRQVGQLKFGIVTSDGVIVDGNRRVSLMNKILSDARATQEEKNRCKFFRAVILPENATKKDILQLETSFQMGEDEKVDYNPIEKYLKCKDLEDAGFTRDEIANFMGIKKKDIDTNLEILSLMDEYLSFYEYDGIYTMAEGHEDSFQKLNIALKQYSAGVANMWSFTPEDVNNLKAVSFDYIRLGLAQNDIRDLFRKPGQASSSVFGTKTRWENFLDKHNEAVASYEEKSVDEYIQNATGDDIIPCMQARDQEWRKHVKQQMEDNFNAAQDDIDSQLRAKEPMLLVKKALGAIASLGFIDPQASSIKKYQVEILEGLQNLIQQAEELRSRIDE